MNRRPCRRPDRKGFTIIELLVAISVLALAGVLIVQIMDGTARSTRISNRAIDAANQARLVFDRIGMDLAALIRRPDTDFQAQNDSLLFLTGVSSPDILSQTGLPGGNRGESVVGYKVGAHGDNPDASGTARICLLRGTVPIGWNETGFMGMSGGLPQRLVPPSSYLPGDFDILAPGVLRMVVGFQLSADNQPATLQNNTLVTAAGQIVYSPPIRSLSPSSPPGGPTVNYIDLDRISALVVGLVAVDAESLKQINSSGANALAACFPVPTSPVTPAASWAQLANSATTAASLGGLPPPVLQSVRVYQRIYPMAPYGRK